MHTRKLFIDRFNHNFTMSNCECVYSAHMCFECFCEFCIESAAAYYAKKIDGFKLVRKTQVTL